MLARRNMSMHAAVSIHDAANGATAPFTERIEGGRCIEGVEVGWHMVALMITRYVGGISVD
jgi:hypothetical protein